MLRDDRAHPCDSRSLHLWVLCFLAPRRSRVLDFPTGTITLLFTDIEGSTLLLQQVGEQYSRVLAQCRQALRTAFQPSQGHQTGPQGKTSSFPSPLARPPVLAP